jgi:ABC-type transport system involved in cytochrome c biogenesis permease subunit
MDNTTILSIVTFVYGLAAFLYVASWVFKKPLVGKLASWVAVTGFIGIIMRWVESYRLGIGHAPLSNMYESLIFFAWTLVLIYLVIERQYKNLVIGAFATPFAFLAMAYASLSPNISDRIQPLIPFAIAFGLSLMYLLKQKDPDNKSKLFSLFPNSFTLDELTHQMVVFGYLFLSVGIITGAVWANSAWGSVCLFNHAACQDDARLARETDCLPFSNWFYGCSVYVFRG